MSLSSEVLAEFIVLHGIDGTGKSSTSRFVTAQNNQKGRPTINYDEYEKGLDSPYRKIKDRIKAEGSIEEQLAFFLASTLFHSQKITQLVESGLTVVKSRYLLDVAAHHSHLGCRNVEQLIALFPFFSPSLQVILIAEEMERQRRIQQRPEKNSQDLIKNEEGSRAWYFEQYLLKHAQQIHPSAHTYVVDTTALPQTAVAQKVISRMEALHA